MRRKGGDQYADNLARSNCKGSGSSSVWLEARAPQHNLQGIKGATKSISHHRRWWNRGVPSCAMLANAAASAATLSSPCCWCLTLCALAPRRPVDAVPCCCWCLCCRSCWCSCSSSSTLPSHSKNSAPWAASSWCVPGSENAHTNKHTRQAVETRLTTDYPRVPL